MYLEVSGRGTGKSTRCIEKACELHFNNIDFYLLMHNSKNIPYFLHKYFIPISSFNMETYFTSANPYDRKDILIIDEFESLRGKIPNNPNYTKNWYVVGTPYYNKSDNLTTLIDMNNGIYVKYVNDNVIKHLSATSINIFPNESKGEFIDS